MAPARSTGVRLRRCARSCDVAEPKLITSRDNPLLVRLRKLAADPAAYRKQGEVWIEGEHLCQAFVQRGGVVPQAVVSEAGWQNPAVRGLLKDAAAVAIVKGDAKVRAISAASILAKVQRDRLCLALHEQHPLYGFDVHKGYPTPLHLAALREHGACAQHRRSFAPVRDVLLRG